MLVKVSERELYIMDDGFYHPLFVFYLYKPSDNKIQRVHTLFKLKNGVYEFGHFELKTVDMSSGYVCYAEMEDLLYVFENWKKQRDNLHTRIIQNVIFDVMGSSVIPHEDVRDTLKIAWGMFSLEN